MALLDSMTKMIVAIDALQLVERGRLEVDVDLGDVLPWLARRHGLEGLDTDGHPVLRPRERRPCSAACSPTRPVTATTSEM